MELIIIRHGESEADLLGVHEGRADFPLTDYGREQAGKMAAYIAAKWKPDIILASTLKRAWETAQFLQKATGCELVAETDLMEFNNGVLAGLPREVAATKYPLPPGGRPPHIPIDGGESELEFRFRAEAVFQKILHEQPTDGRIAIVSHGGMISKLINAFLGLPVANETIFPTGDTGFHVLQTKNGRKMIRILNSQVHLES
ncbi:histidine phosphatase family protein [Neobacillus piezotolerans]|uniref:Histidine phosphatase family protein n=1 Tax=Neobacillus piezotolerans TaxID=2259171 RepID=A0A3D8GN17_9BACI|nr:histidine phosphatase family protein [Neobacillus piezotolerans]RDU35707.1 histidine phosphatase family protein [Neobacillus piezotolerans]